MKTVVVELSPREALAVLEVLRQLELLPVRSQSDVRQVSAWLGKRLDAAVDQALRED